MPRPAMRWVALSILILAAGCNGLLGNDVGRLAPDGGGGTAGGGNSGGTGGAAAGGGVGNAPGDAGPEGSTAALAIAPTNHDFGSVVFATASAKASFNLSNSGGTATGALQIALSGSNAADFKIAPSSNCVTKLAAGASCTLDITVTPSAAGSLTATLGVSASPGGSASATLTAKGEYAYAALDGSAKWKSFDTTKVDAAATNFEGAAFDGRYLYLVPKQGVAARFDTQGSFDNVGSWTAFDTSNVTGSVLARESAVFDGRYVYLIPTYAGIVTRFDTTKTFTALSSWTTFDTTTVSTGAKGFIGAAFDGQYIYFVPFNNGSYDGVVTRYDTSTGFTNKASWTTFDAASVNANAVGFIGGIFDGRYVYFVPRQSTVLRYDTNHNFATSSSWATFNLGSVDTAARGFQGGAFDGRYVYFVPYRNSTYDGVVARFDTQGTFGNTAAWKTFNTATVDPNARGFVGAAFDGRYLYLAPYFNGAYDGVVTRLDTTGAFTNAGSWTTYDVTNVDTGAKGFAGAAFDGRYLYLVPGTNSSVTRFDARQPRSMPSLCGIQKALYCYSGSFL